MLDQVNRYTCGSKPRDPGSGRTRIGIEAADHDPGKACPADQIGTGRTAIALVGTGFKSNVQRGTARSFAGCCQGGCFGVGPPPGLGPASGHDTPVPDQDCAY